MNGVTYLEGLDALLAAGAARLGPAFVGRQLEWVRGRQQADGGFPGRQGGSDPYYSDFALRILGLFPEEQEARERAAGYWRGLDRPPADVVQCFHRLNAARILRRWGIEVPLDREALAVVLARQALPGGGFARPGGKVPSAYQTFLGALCADMAGAAGEMALRLQESAAGGVAAVSALRRPDGGYGDLPGDAAGQTNPAAAALGFFALREVGDPAGREQTVRFLAAMQAPDGGLRAHPDAPVGDLLSTFTGLLTLAWLERLGEVDLAGVARFVRALAAPGGGFCAAPGDNEPDIEYTYYGIGTLALLRLHVEARVGRERRVRILHLAAGAGGMYCGACARDLALVRGLSARGHEVQVVPLYTPLRSDDGSAPDAPVFYGGINVFLQQASVLFRKLPGAFDRFLDSPGLIRWVSQFAIETRAENLGPMTVSVLAGKHGRQRKELEKLIRYLEAQPRPDVVSLTNSLLSGVAPALKERLGVPIVCSLQGEDGFVGAMREPHRSEALRLMRENARAVDLFLAPGDAYAARMADLLAVSPEQVRVVQPGIVAEAFAPAGSRPRRPFTIGYLSVITPGKGLDLLVDAFHALTKEREQEIVLAVAGRPLNQRYWRSLQKRIADLGLEGQFHYRGEVDFAGKVAFLRRCSVFCVPSRMAEARGMAWMEAMAAGVPVVAPNAGVFPELIGLTGGGVLVPPGDAAAVGRALADLLDDPDAADRMGRAGAEGIARHFTADRMAEAALEALFAASAAGAEQGRGERSDPPD